VFVKKKNRADEFERIEKDASAQIHFVWSIKNCTCLFFWVYKNVSAPYEMRMAIIHFLFLSWSKGNPESYTQLQRADNNIMIVYEFNSYLVHPSVTSNLSGKFLLELRKLTQPSDNFYYFKNQINRTQTNLIRSRCHLYQFPASVPIEKHQAMQIFNSFPVVVGNLWRYLTATIFLFHLYLKKFKARCPVNHWSHLF
jgi:hypothetical protein